MVLMTLGFNYETEPLFQCVWRSSMRVVYETRPKEITSRTPEGRRAQRGDDWANGLRSLGEVRLPS